MLVMTNCMVESDLAYFCIGETEGVSFAAEVPPRTANGQVSQSAYRKESPWRGGRSIEARPFGPFPVEGKMSSCGTRCA